MYGKVMHALEILTMETNHLSLESKTTAPFIIMNSDWDKNMPPTTKYDLLRAGSLHEHEEEGSFKKQSLEDFLATQPEELQYLSQVFNAFSNPETRSVYLVGDDTVFVLILAVLRDPDNRKRFSLVGLKSLIEK